MNQPFGRVSSRQNILFICARDPMCATQRDGGAVVTQSNYEVLSALAQVDIFSVRSHAADVFEKALRIFFGFFGFSGSAYPWTLWRLKRLVGQKEYSLVFIDHSLYGRFARTIRKQSPYTRILTHFQNIESAYQMASIQAPWLVRYILARAANYNEKLAVKYSNKLICLTGVDSELLHATYKRHADHIVPISLSSVDLVHNFSDVPITEPYLLFCGSNFSPNVQGIKWFIDNILPLIPFRLVIVGIGMDRVAFPDSDKTHVFGAVPDLSPFYTNAMAVISPIFVKGGMKTKVIDAMRFGKQILATSESLIGIEWECVQGVHRCDSIADFVQAINGLDEGVESRYCESVHCLFKTKYSTEVKRAFFQKNIL